MTELKSISNSELRTRLQQLVQKERQVTLDILWHLHEVEVRKLHLVLGFHSLFDYATRELGYSSAAASRRIESMRLLREVPKVESKIQSGELHLSTVSLVQGFLRNELKVQKKEYSADQKQDLLEQVAGKSTREAEKVLAAINPESIPVRSVQRVISATHTEVRFVADDETLKLLEEVKDQMGGRNAFPDLNLVVKTLARAFLAKKKVAPTSNVSSKLPGHNVTRSRYVPVQTKRQLLHKANYQCEYRAASSSGEPGQRCTNTRALQLDHMLSFWQSTQKR